MKCNAGGGDGRLQSFRVCVCVGVYVCVCVCVCVYLFNFAMQVAEMGGLHGFTSWPRAMLTDSGGFQVRAIIPAHR